MKKLFLLILLSGCAHTQENVYVPTDVDVPVELKCKIPFIQPPPDLLATLPVNATLTDGMKSCLAQHDYEIGYIGQLLSSIQTCQ